MDLSNVAVAVVVCIGDWVLTPMDLSNVAVAVVVCKMYPILNANMHVN